MATYKAVDKEIDITVVNNLVVSGLARMRADTTEIDNLLPSIGVTKLSQFKSWFISDKATIQHGWWYPDISEQLPSIHYLIESDVTAEKFIGDYEEDYDPTSDFTHENTIYSYPFNKKLTALIRHDNPEYANYLYEIVKYILLTKNHEFINDHYWKDLKYFGRFSNMLTNGSNLVYEYMMSMTYYKEDKIMERKTAQLITTVEINETITSITLTNKPYTDQRLT